MLLDKTLVLKGLAGVAAVGGVVGGGFAVKKAGLLSPSSNAGDAQPGPTNPNTGGASTVSHSNADVSRGDGNVDNTPQQEQKLTVTADHGDEKGLLTECETKKKCELTEDTIKRVKFKDLDRGEGDVTVTPSSTVNVVLEIKGDNGTKRYVFENRGSETVTLTKGSVSFGLPVGKSRFVVEGNKFNPMKMGIYGLPSRCSSGCDLLGDDLGLIHFSGFEGTGEATVTGLAEEQKVSLTIENGTYVFNSPSSVTITKGGSSVNLESGETDFGVDGDKLKMVELWTFGLPKDCEYKEESDPKTCELSSRDLKKVKFKDIGSSPNVSGLKGTEKVTLEIKKTEDSSYPDGKKYTFTSGGSGDVTITKNGTSQSVTISKGDYENVFKKEDVSSEVLVALPKRVKPTDEVKGLDNKINDLGLPSTCTFTEKASGDKKSIECELSKDELKKVKFADKDGNDLTIKDIDGDDINYKIRIEEAADDKHFSSKNIRVTFLNRDSNPWSKMLTLNATEDSGSNEPLIIYKNSGTEFKITDKNRLQKAWKISDLSGLVGLNCGEESDTSTNCSLKSGSETIKVYLEEGIKDFKPGDLGSYLCFGEDEDGFSQGIKFRVSSAIEGTVNNESKTLETGEYEIRRFEGKGWALVKQSLNHNYSQIGG